MLQLATQRLRLRPVRDDDLDAVAALGADERVMAALGGALTREKSASWLGRQIEHWREHRMGRFFVERDGVFVGLAGLSRTEFDAAFTPATEIAWRFAFDHWGKGYATEAAREVARDGFERLSLDEIVGFTRPDNVRSRRVMERLGMEYCPHETFEHPLVAEDSLHVLYRLRAPSFARAPALPLP